MRPAMSGKEGMPRLTASRRRATRPSTWASLLFAAARLTFRPSASPVQPSRRASLMRAVRLSRISSSRGRWAGSTRRSGHLTQLYPDQQIPANHLKTGKHLKAPNGALATPTGGMRPRSTPR